MHFCNPVSFFHHHTTKQPKQFHTSLLSFTGSSWAHAIRSASQQGRFKHALSLYIQVRRSDSSPSSFALSAALRACARIPAKSSGTAIHAQVFKFGQHRNVYIQTALVDLYSKLGETDVARKLFDEMPERNVVSWNSILAGYVRAGALKMARRVFDEMPVRDVVSWNSMVSGYAKEGDMDRAWSLFWEMPLRNAASWNGMISGFVDCGNVRAARELFDEMPDRSNVSYIAMISGYMRCGDVDSARELFDRMDERDCPSWNAMIACYAQNSRPEEAIQLFNRMQKIDTNVQPNEMTFVSVLSACSQLGNLRFGSWVEQYMHSIGVELDGHLITALVDLYAKCGSINKAYSLFQSLRRRDLIAYSAMIFGCGINGKATDAIRLFQEMVEAKISPNEVTFTGLLTAYNHAGMVEEGYRCFASMDGKHGVLPSADHYAIMVDLLGRAGRLEEAHELIKSMPMQPHVGVWGALLLACRIHGNVDLGEIATRQCLELEPKAEASGYYVLLANIYASVGRWDDAKRLRKMVEEKGLSKVPGLSWMNVT